MNSESKVDNKSEMWPSEIYIEDEEKLRGWMWKLIKFTLKIEGVEREKAKVRKWESKSKIIFEGG